MKQIISMLIAIACTGCAMGINHNVVILDGKPYLVETPTYVTPILPIYQWSEQSSFTELTAPENAPTDSVKEKELDISKQKEIWLEIVHKCQQLYSRKALDREKCIEREINAL